GDRERGSRAALRDRDVGGARGRDREVVERDVVDRDRVACAVVFGEQGDGEVVSGRNGDAGYAVDDRHVVVRTCGQVGVEHQRRGEGNRRAGQVGGVDLQDVQRIARDHG